MTARLFPAVSEAVSDAESVQQAFLAALSLPPTGPGVNLVILGMHQRMSVISMRHRLSLPKEFNGTARHSDGFFFSSAHEWGFAAFACLLLGSRTP